MESIRFLFIETSEETTSSLATAMSKGELKGLESIRNFLARQTNETDINVADSDGMTALMIACGNGQEDIVRFLIENGANPNISSPKNGDTSLYVICRKEKHSQQNIAHETRVKIVQTLLQHGATFRKNEAGLTPLQLAALSPLDSLVEFFISYQGSDIEIAEADKIIALEMLGLSQCLDGQRSRSFDTLCEIVSRGYHPPEGRKDPELVALFHYPEPRLDSFIDACVLMRIKYGLEINWILIGDRIIPEGAKGKYFFTRLANYACSFLRDRKTTGRSIFKYLLSCESQSKAVLGTVMSRTSPLFYYAMDPDAVSHGCEVVNGYRDVIQHVSKSCLIEHGPQLLQSYGRVLFRFALYSSDLSLLESMIKTAQIVISKVRTACNCSTSDSIERTAKSVTYLIMEELAEALVDRHEWWYHPVASSSLYRLKRVMCKLFWYDDVTYVDDENNTMLHLLAYSASAASDMSVIVDLARIVIRHGCPVNQRNDDYCTALNKVMQNSSFRLDDDASKELVDLLNPTSSLLTLEEMASRTILENRIPYHGVLPKTICEKIEGETMVPDIGTLIDSDDGTDSQNLDSDGIDSQNSDSDGTDSQNSNSEGTDSQNSDSETDSKYSDSETDSQ